MATWTQRAGLAADLWGIGVDAEGKIPFQRNPSNGYRLFRRADLERFLRQAAQPVQPIRRKKPR